MTLEEDEEHHWNCLCQNKILKVEALGYPNVLVYSPKKIIDLDYQETMKLNMKPIKYDRANIKAKQSE